jgi:hypothetical protein
MEYICTQRIYGRFSELDFWRNSASVTGNMQTDVSGIEHKIVRSFHSLIFKPRAMSPGDKFENFANHDCRSLY